MVFAVVVECDFGSMTEDFGETGVGHMLVQEGRWSGGGKYFEFFICVLNDGTGVKAKDV